jgi:carbon-monoxide dehydrogenase small subunit
MAAERGAAPVARVDGATVRVPTGGTRLLDWLRDELGLVAPKEGCGAGHCGACTVLLDGAPALSCCVLAATVAGRDVRTAAALVREPPGARLQRAFARHGAVQCGFCTPGMLTACYAWMREREDRAQESGELFELDETDETGDADPRAGRPAPARDELRAALVGNVCRCTGYAQIVAATLDAAGDQAR